MFQCILDNFKIFSAHIFILNMGSKHLSVFLLSSPKKIAKIFSLFSLISFLLKSYTFSFMGSAHMSSKAKVGKRFSANYTIKILYFEITFLDWLEVDVFRFHNLY